MTHSTSFTANAKSTWILVAQRAEAIIFSSRGADLPLQIVAELDNPRGRKQAIEIDSDRPGRTFDRAGFGRHALSSQESAAQHLEREFAQRLADRLDSERCAGIFDQLILIAGPRMMGELRDAVSAPTRRLIRVEVAKELLRPTQHDVRRHLQGLARV